MNTVKLGREVVISDPCYTIPTWCQIIVKTVLEGEYIPFVTKTDNTGGWGERVSKLSLIHKDYLTKGYLWKKMDGTLGVDSGQCGIFSKESYRNDKFNIETPESDFSIVRYQEGDEWYEKMCRFTLGSESWGSYDEGVVSSSGYGDGSYDLYCMKTNNGEIVGFLIDYQVEEFDEDEDFDDE